MEIKESGQSLAEFLDESPCNFLATQSIAKRLEAAGYQRLSQRDKWAVKPGDRFYVTKNEQTCRRIWWKLRKQNEIFPSDR